MTATYHPSPQSPTHPRLTDPAKRKSGGTKEKEKEKKDPHDDDPNKGEDDHPFRIGAWVGFPVGNHIVSPVDCCTYVS